MAASAAAKTRHAPRPNHEALHIGHRRSLMRRTRLGHGCATSQFALRTRLNLEIFVSSRRLQPGVRISLEDFDDRMAEIERIEARRAKARRLAVVLYAQAAVALALYVSLLVLVLVIGVVRFLWMIGQDGESLADAASTGLLVSGALAVTRRVPSASGNALNR